MYPRSARSPSNSKAEEELCRLQAEFCKGMANPKRIHLLRVLEGGEMTVAELEKLTGMPQGNLSQHLALLRQLGLLRARRSGLNVYYGISDPRIVEACDLVRGCIAERLKRSQAMLAQVR